ERRCFFGGADPLQRLHVGAGDEPVRLPAGKHDRGDRRIVRGAAEQLLELAGEVGAERIDRLAGDVHEDDPDAGGCDLESERAVCRLWSARCHVYSRVRMQAAPSPPAAQIDTSPVAALRAAISRSAWCTRRAPVAPKGCPSEMEPPFGLILFSGGSPMDSAPPRCSCANFFEPHACRLERTCAENASWISHRSTSATVIPARRSTLGTENAGACKSCQAGSTAAYAYSLK